MKKLLVIILIFLILPICNYIVSADNTTYMEDFEKTTNASDYILAGNPTSKSIVNIDNNKQLLLSRAANATGDGWVDKTFSTPFSGDIVLEMKIKSTSSIFHQVKLSKAGGGSLPPFNISGNGCSLNGTYKDLPNRGDGKFHSYKFVIKNLVAGSNALIDFYYDNSKLFSDVSSSSILADVNNLRFALSAGSSVSEVYFDNIAIYPLANPIPSIVKCSPEGGVLKPSDKITLTGDNGADIYYTLDGSTPTQTSNLYTGPFSLLNDNATIRTIAIKNNFGGFVANYGPFSVENFIFNDFEVGVDNFFKTISGNAPILQTTNFNNMARLDVGNYKLDFAAPFTANFKIVFLQEGNSKITLYNNSNVAGSFLASSGSYSLSVDYTNKIVSVVNNGILQETINITENQLTSLEFLTSSSVLLDDFSAYKASTSIPSPVACSAVPGYISREKGITLTAETGAVIRYTSDGSIPTVSSTIYTAPILPSNLKTIIKAKAFKDGKESFCRAFGEFKLDNSYQYDFEKYNENATIASIGFFDGDYGNLATNKVVKENGNTAIYFERNSVDSSTGAWVQKTFPTPYSEDFIFQFKMKSTVAEFKQVTMTTNVSGKNVGLNISPGGCTINGQTISMPDFSDGNYHNYEFHIKFTPLGASFDFYYDKMLL